MILNDEEKRYIDEENKYSKEAVPDNSKASEQIYEKASSAKHMMRRSELHNENHMRQKLLKNRTKRLNKKKTNILVYLLFILILILLILLYWNNRIFVNQWFIDLYESLLDKF